MSVAERRRQAGDVEPSLSSLSISGGGTKNKARSSAATNNRANNKKAPVADSWEDEAASLSPDEEEDEDSEDEDSEPTTPTATTASHSRAESTASSASHSSSYSSSSYPTAPPPTPSSPSGMFENPYSLPSTFPTATRQRGSPPSARPEKTVGAASRMIAGALGVKPPKRGEEMRAFEKAAREKEERRRAREREEKREGERKKEAVWED